jgi:hypothetical protein
MEYDHDYYESGVETGLSNYQNYRWIPELTFPLAMSIIDFLHIKPNETVIDFGCAKAYLVRALRMLHRDAWGSDISEYALSQSDEEVKPYLMKVRTLLADWEEHKSPFKYGICKDVLEHIPEYELIHLLEVFNVERLFTVIPLGVCGKYVAPANDRDKSHIICEDSDWWLNLFQRCGWVCIYNSTEVKGIKDSYSDLYPNSHLFTVYRR